VEKKIDDPDIPMVLFVPFADALETKPFVGCHCLHPFVGNDAVDGAERRRCCHPHHHVVGCATLDDRWAKVFLRCRTPQRVVGAPKRQ